MLAVRVKLFYGEGLTTIEIDANNFIKTNKLETENFISFDVAMADGNKRYYCATLIYRREI